jgi:DNA-binding MarR family transcriptional regulator
MKPMTAQRPAPATAPAQSTGSLQTASRLRLAVGRLYRSFRLDGASELTTAQLTLLASVDRNGPIRLGDLAAQEGLQPSSLTRGVAWLTARGLVERSVSTDDRRATIVVISPAGKALLGDAWNLRSTHLAARIARLSPQHQAALIEALPLLEALLVELD